MIELSLRSLSIIMTASYSYSAGLIHYQSSAALRRVGDKECARFEILRRKRRRYIPTSRSSPLFALVPILQAIIVAFVILTNSVSQHGEPLVLMPKATIYWLLLHLLPLNIFTKDRNVRNDTTWRDHFPLSYPFLWMICFATSQTDFFLPLVVSPCDDVEHPLLEPR